MPVIGTQTAQIQRPRPKMSMHFRKSMLEWERPTNSRQVAAMCRLSAQLDFTIRARHLTRWTKSESAAMNFSPSGCDVDETWLLSTSSCSQTPRTHPPHCDENPLLPSDNPRACCRITSSCSPLDGAHHLSRIDLTREGKSKSQFKHAKKVNVTNHQTNKQPINTKVIRNPNPCTEPAADVGPVN